ncbi:Hypothetical protein A7982_08155 [Minicystis rosea]|nr:Hypothetical protein A7982_08155 [Minicystis rosea]
MDEATSLRAFSIDASEAPSRARDPFAIDLGPCSGPGSPPSSTSR